ncbi:MAG: DUF4442 domain-containing protein [Polyangiales bacterium]
MKNKIRARLYRTVLNLWPCIAGAGGRVTYLSEDFSHLKVALPLTWRTWNAFGTIYGGSMYASTDPFYTLMLTRLLGKDYIVWDKGCTIRFKRPAKVTLTADFHITPEMLADVKEKVVQAGEAEFVWTVRFVDDAGAVYAEFDKVVYVATKASYKAKQEARASRQREAAV